MTLQGSGNEYYSGETSRGPSSRWSGDHKGVLPGTDADTDMDTAMDTGLGGLGDSLGSSRYDDLNRSRDRSRSRSRSRSASVDRSLHEGRSMGYGGERSYRSRDETPRATLYVRGFVTGVRAKTLADVFERYGPVAQVDVLPPRRSDGEQYAFVAFRSISAMNAVLDDIESGRPIDGGVAIDPKVGLLCERARRLPVSRRVTTAGSQRRDGRYGGRHGVGLSRESDYDRGSRHERRERECERRERDCERSYRGMRSIPRSGSIPRSRSGPTSRSRSPDRAVAEK